MQRLFLDTNILMDAICNREHAPEAQTVLDMGLRGEVVLYCTSLTIANCVYNCRKTLGKEVTRELLKRLCDFIHIAPSGQTEIDKAFSTLNPDFEDALQNFSAESVQADVILTRNEKHFQYSSILVMDCMTYLNNL